MIELILGSLLVIAIGIALAEARRLHVEMLSNAGYVETIRYQDTTVATAFEDVVRLRKEIALIRHDARLEARVYMERALAYEKMIMEKNRQIGNMAERIASLKLVPGAGVEGGEDMHVEDIPPEEPYSPELQEWIDGLADSETRNRAHDFVDIRRRNHLSDEQILQDLEDSWTV